MKNILSSLNESEKKRILEMHYRASGKQIISEEFKSNITAAELATVYATKAEVLGTDKPTGISFTFLPQYQQKDAGNIIYNCNSAGKYYSEKFQNIGPYNGIGLVFGTEGLPLGMILDKMEVLGKRQCEASAKLAPKPVAKTTTPALPKKSPEEVAFNNKMFSLTSKYGKSDYFSLNELAATGGSTVQNPVLHITLKPSAINTFVNVGTQDNHMYGCKTGWGLVKGGPNPYETNITLNYKAPKGSQQDYSIYDQIDTGKTPAKIAQEFVTNVCSGLGY
jgi:hypothetical protein